MSDPLLEPPDRSLDPAVPSDSQEPPQPSDPASAIATERSGLTFHLLLQLPEPQRDLINWLLRQSEDCTFAQIQEYLQQDEAEIRSLLEILLSAGFLQTRHQHHQTYYGVQMRSMRQSRRWCPPI